MLTAIKCGPLERGCPSAPIYQPTIETLTDEDHYGRLLDELDTLISTLDNALEMNVEARLALAESDRLIALVSAKISLAQAALADAQRRRTPLGAVAADRRVRQ